MSHCTCICCGMKGQNNVYLAIPVAVWWHTHGSYCTICIHTHGSFQLHADNSNWYSVGHADNSNSMQTYTSQFPTDILWEQLAPLTYFAQVLQSVVNPSCLCYGWSNLCILTRGTCAQQFTIVPKPPHHCPPVYNVCHVVPWSVICSCWTHLGNVS